MNTERFSQRIGTVPKRSALQLGEIDNDLRNTLWNKINGFFAKGNHVEWNNAAKRLAEYFYKVPVDELPFDKIKCREWLKKRFYDAPWYQVYDLLEFMVQYWGLLPFGPGLIQENVRKILNNVLESEGSGYRFVANSLVPITSEVEVAAIHEAISTSLPQGMAGAEKHLSAAVRLLALKPVPDYRNSVKESISAVESVVKVLSGNDSGGVSGALDELQKKIEIHGALKGAFVKLYGYTSDSAGIRHAILDESSVGFDEAKYMLVACSAFVFYLATKHAKVAGLSP